MAGETAGKIREIYGLPPELPEAADPDGEESNPVKPNEQPAPGGSVPCSVKRSLNRCSVAQLPEIIGATGWAACPAIGINTIAKPKTKNIG